MALDLALQAAPDHPWVAEHPEWFTTLPDGSIAYAENPPKKYQDIYPINFDNDPAGISAEVLRIVRHWIAQGVKIFRVDNPHTKPLQFWEWLIATRERGASGRRLPRRGLHASGTSRGPRDRRVPAELLVLHLAQHQGRARGVPRLGVDRHRRLHASEPLREHPRHPHRVPAVRRASGIPDPRCHRGHGGAALRRVRRLRALRERRAAGVGREHRQREVRVQDPRLGGRRSRGDSLAPYLTRLNEIRREHPALRQLRNFSAHWSDDDAILVYSKHLDADVSPDRPQRHDHRRRQRRPALRAPDDGASRHHRSGASRPASPTRSRTSSRASNGPGPITTSSGSTPSPNRSTSST